MKKREIKSDISAYIDFEKYENKEIELVGMIQNVRILSWGAFLVVRSNGYAIQSVIDKNKVSIILDNIVTESTIKIKGILKSAIIKDISLYPRNYEIQVTDIEVISLPSVKEFPFDITKKELNISLDINLNYRPLSLRHPVNRAIFKISSIIYNEFGNFLSSVGFTGINSPKIVATGAEGGAEIFKLDYFGKPAYLAQSPQFYKQMMVGVFGRVFEAAPVFRAEKHNTSRHINEYTSLDFEMMLTDSYEEIIQVEANLIRHIIEKLKSECQADIELLNMKIPELNEIILVEFNDVHEIVYKEFNKDFRGRNDLAPEEEILICEYAVEKWNTEFVFVTHYPSEKRPFYAMNDPNDSSKTLSFDLLFRGVEITTGGQRMHKYEDYIRKMNKLKMDTSLIESYLQAFKFGMPPHGGLAIGLERLTSKICGVKNIKEATLFPRDIDRLEP